MPFSSARGRGGALEHGQMRHGGLDRGDELDGRGSGADDGDAFAGQIDAVVPPGGVEPRSGEAADARQVRYERVGERAGSDDDVGGGAVTACGLQPPSVGGGIPVEAGYLAVGDGGAGRGGR
jgi:hypothetical protein